jgi:ParB family chromosome partitioning protein
MAPRRPLSTAGLASAMATIDDAKTLIIKRGSTFNHSFEADVAKVQPDPAQPRKSFADTEITELAATMQAQGQLQPILVRPNAAERGGWIIVAGERRWRAARLNGWPSILAVEFSGDHDVATLLENLQRVDLTPVEEARGISRLIVEKSWSQTQAGIVLGKSKSEISSLLRILDLPADILDGVSTSKLALPRNVLSELARLPEGPGRDELLAAARSGNLTLRMLRSTREAAPSSPRPAEPGAGRTIGAITIYRMADQVRRLQAAKPVLDKPQRDALLSLQEAIAAILRD